MATTINNNFSNARQLATAHKESTKVLNKLSSGSRINSAKDTAAGLAGSDRMDAKFRGLHQAMRNVGDGISLLQTAEEGLNQTTEVLQHMRELALQAESGHYSSADRGAINLEMAELRQKLGRVADQTTFNDKKVLDGKMAAGETFQVGLRAEESIQIQLDSIRAEDLGVENINVLSVAGAQNAVASIDEALDSVSEMKKDLGVQEQIFQSVITNLHNIAENITASKSRITDADYAAEVSEMVKRHILKQGDAAIQAQANQSSNASHSLLK